MKHKGYIYNVSKEQFIADNLHKINKEIYRILDYRVKWHAHENHDVVNIINESARNLKDRFLLRNDIDILDTDDIIQLINNLVSELEIKQMVQDKYEQIRIREELRQLECDDE